MRCPNCAHENPEGYVFCGRCGRAGASTENLVLTEVLPPVAMPPRPAHSRQMPYQPPMFAPRETGQDEATRYLCAAAHLDSKFAERLVTKVLEEPLRAVAQSPALNLTAVLKHVAAARTRHLYRDASLVAMLVLFLVGVFSLSAILILVSIVLAWGIVFAEAYAARWGLVARTLRREAFDAAAAPEPARPILREQIALADTYTGGNVTAYREYKPFMGYGPILDGWSMALDVTTPDDEDEPISPFSIDELHGRLKKDLAELDFPRLNVYDRLFIDGGDIHHDDRFLAGRRARPVERVDDAIMARLREHTEDRARPYLVAEIVGWGGELVFTAFVRVALTSTNLFVEASYSLLPPMHPAYHEIDELLHAPSFRQLARITGRSFAQAFVMSFFSVPRTGRQAFARFRQSRKATRQQREMDQYVSFNHGALISIRELASDLRADARPGYQRHFQFLDKEMYTKVVEKKIFDTLCQFLQDKNIDPDELLRRSENIINNGVMLSGNARIVGSAVGGKAAKVSSKAG